NEALVNANWGAARRLFSESLEQGETPEALEGLATAAFFLDEAELALDARERAYAGYRKGRPRRRCGPHCDRAGLGLPDRPRRASGQRRVAGTGPPAARGPRTDAGTRLAGVARSILRAAG